MGHYLAKIGIGILGITAYVFFCWGIFVSPNSYFLIAVIGLTLSLINSIGLAALWIFYLSKQFSTHKLKVLDIKKTAQTMKPVIDEGFDHEGEEEKRITDFANTTTAALFNRTKEKFSDNLR